MICRVLEDIAYRLDALQVAKNAHAFDSVAKPARRIVHVAAQIGLLERAFDLAVTEILQFRDNMH